MTRSSAFHGLLVAALLFGSVADAAAGVRLRDVSATHLPVADLTGNSMDAEVLDLENDGDLDIVLAGEFRTNIILINDGTGKFSNQSGARLPQVVHDSEDIGFGDFNCDGAIDIVFVSEDDRTNELYFNNGSDVFQDETARLGVTGVSNAVLAVDVDGDDDTDIIIGNAGQNVVLINNCDGTFTDETSTRLPVNTHITQDLEWGDIDGDGDADIVEANENGNRLLRNNGSGVFTDETFKRLPLLGEETREADLGDVDGDGDLDLFLANVTFSQGQPSHNRLLVNDGHGFFTDESATRIPTVAQHTVDGDFADIDGDGDLDLLTAQAFNGTFQVLTNNGDGVFTDVTSEIFINAPNGNGIDVEVADFNKDGVPDVYLCGFGRADYLFFGEKDSTPVTATPWSKTKQFYR